MLRGNTAESKLLLNVADSWFAAAAETLGDHEVRGVAESVAGPLGLELPATAKNASSTDTPSRMRIGWVRRRSATAAFRRTHARNG